MFTYLELKEKKENGEKLDFDLITKKQLERLFYNDNCSDSIIADLYDIDKKDVKKKRYKWDIKFFNADYICRKTLNNDNKLNSLNEFAKNELIKEENIEWLSKALTHYLFRNGPVEDMHADGKLSQDDMKTLNKYMVNRTAGLLKTLFDGEWIKILVLFDSIFYRNCGSNWDKPKYDVVELDMVFKCFVKDYNRSKRG